MKLQIRCIGHENDKFLNQAIATYVKRLSKPFALEIKAFAHSKHKNIAQQKAEEAKLLLSDLPKDSTYIAAVIAGKNYSTEELSAVISKASTAVLFIGGCNGLDESVLEQCSIHWSISRLTLPHGMVRLIVAEQWYRLNSIYKQHPYHE